MLTLYYRYNPPGEVLLDISFRFGHYEANKVKERISDRTEDFAIHSI